MPITLKTPNQISDEIVADVEVGLGLSKPIPAKGYTRVVAKAFAGALHLLYSHSNYWAQQLFTSTASNRPVDVNGRRFTPLVEHGIALGAGEPKQASRAVLGVIVEVASIGTTVNAGTTLLGPNGYVYAFKSSTTFQKFRVTVQVIASGDPLDRGGLGAAGNLPKGTKLSFTTSRSDVVTEAIVSHLETAAADEESTEDYRRRVGARRQRPPQGGALADYREWGIGVGGIVSVYPYSTAPGQVSVFVRATSESSGDPDGVPTQSQLDAVAASIEFDSSGQAKRKPTDVRLNVWPIKFAPVVVRVEGLEASDVDTVKAQIAESIKSVLASHQPWIRGLSTERRDRVSRSAIESAVQRVVAANNATQEGVTLLIEGRSAGSFAVRITADNDEWTVREGATESQSTGNKTLCRQHFGALESGLVSYVFRNVSIPVGARIDSAKMEWVAGRSDVAPHDGIVIQTALSENPFAYSGGADSTTNGEARSTSLVPWDPSVWAAGFSYPSPELASIVQEVVDLPAWSGTHNLKFILTQVPGATQERVAVSHDVDSNVAALLTIDYSTSSGNVSTEFIELPPGTLAKLTEVTYL